MKAANLCSAIGRVTAHTLNGDTFEWKGFYQDPELLKASVSTHTGIPLLLMNLEVVKREGQHVTVSVSQSTIARNYTTRPSTTQELVEQGCEVYKIGASEEGEIYAPTFVCNWTEVKHNHIHIQFFNSKSKEQLCLVMKADNDEVSIWVRSFHRYSSSAFHYRWVDHLLWTRQLRHGCSLEETFGSGDITLTLFFDRKHEVLDIIYYDPLDDLGVGECYIKLLKRIPFPFVEAAELSSNVPLTFRTPPSRLWEVKLHM